MIAAKDRLRSIRTLVVLLVVIVLTGCSIISDRRRDAHNKNGQKYMTERRYDDAFTEFRSAAEIDPASIPSHLGLAQTFEALRDPSNALIEYERVLELDDQNAEALLKVGLYLVSVSRDNAEVAKQAADMANKILKLDSANLEARILLGNALMAQGNLGASILELEKATLQDPSSLEAALSLGAAELQVNPQLAEQTLRETAKNHPNELSPQLALAGFLESVKRMDEAEAYFRKAFDLSPSDPQCLALFGAFYVSNKRAGDAEKLFREAITLKPKSREPYWSLAQFYFAQRLPAKAEAALDDLLKVTPADRSAQMSLATLYVGRKNLPRAEEIAKDLLARNRNDPEAHQLLGSILRARQETDKALAEFETAIRLSSAVRESYVEKANILVTRGDLVGAQNTLEASLLKDKGNVLARGFRAKILALRQLSNDALQEAKAVLDVMPNNEDAIYARGQSFVNLDRPKEAREEFQRLIALHPDEPYYLNRLGLVESSLGDAPAALGHLRKALDLKPDLPNGIDDIASVFLRGKQFDAALAEVDRISKNSAVSQEETHRVRGQVYLARNDLTAAEREFRKTIEINPKNYKVYVLIAQINLARHNLTQAIADANVLIEKNPKFSAGYFLKGYYLEASKDAAGALSNYRKALALEPDNPLFLNNTAWLLAASSDSLNEAKDVAEKARGILPSDPEIADTLGWIYYLRKDYAKAIEQLEFSVKNNPGPDAEHYYRLGTAYFFKGDLRNAKEALRKALALNPSFPGSDEALRMVKILG